MAEPTNTAVAQPIKICSNCRTRNEMESTHCKWCHTNIQNVMAVPSVETCESQEVDRTPLRRLALDYAIQTHGKKNFRVHRDGAQVVTTAAAEYLRFLKTGDALKAEDLDGPEQADPTEEVLPEPAQNVPQATAPADDGDPLLPLFGPQANLNRAQTTASNSFGMFAHNLVENIPPSNERTAALQALLAARANTIKACADVKEG